MNNRDKILFLIDDLGSGGAQNQITLLATELKKRNFQVIFCTYYENNFFSNRLKDAEITNYCYPKKNKYDISIIWHLITLIKKYKINHLISYLDTPNFYGAIIKTLTKKINFICSHRSKTDFGNLNFRRKYFYKFINYKADTIICNSYHEAEGMKQFYSQYAKKIHTIYNGLHPLNFSTAAKSYSISNNFIVVASVTPAKNAKVILSAFNILKNKREDITLKWIGKKETNLPSRKEYILELEDFIANNNLTHIVKWQSETKEIINEYDSAKCLILASITEGVPNVVAEALSRGTPCIVSDVLDHPQIIQQGKNGYLFHPHSATNLAECILKICNMNAIEYNSMSQNAMQSARDLFSLDKQVQKYSDILENALTS